MGPKITIDSATLMNKGLELIEAHYLFGVPYERITVVLDPKSTVHSMARFSDGAILAHLGVPDMRTPIGYALAYPERPPLPQVRRLDLFATSIAFERPDTATFRCLALAEEAGHQGHAGRARGRRRGRGPAHGRRAHRPERRQRGRRGGVPRGAARRSSASPRSSRRASTGSATPPSRRSTTCTRATPRRAASPAKRWPAAPECGRRVLARRAPAGLVPAGAGRRTPRRSPALMWTQPRTGIV